jgi:hypothetical protein
MASRMIAKISSLSEVTIVEGILSFGGGADSIGAGSNAQAPTRTSTANAVGDDGGAVDHRLIHVWIKGRPVRLTSDNSALSDVSAGQYPHRAVGGIRQIAPIDQSRKRSPVTMHYQQLQCYV